LVIGTSGIVFGCSNGTGGGGFATTDTSNQTTDQTSDQSGSSSGGTSATSTGGGNTSTSTTTGGSATATTSGSAAGCTFIDNATPSGKFPFPQGRKYAGCTYPTTIDTTAVCNAYRAWYNGITTADGSNRRVYDKSFDSSNTTSEGMAYGMLIAVYMSDHPAFDAF
jgi:hypothetical protein